MSIDPVLRADTVEEAITERREEWLDIVSDLISIPAENPPGDTTEIAAHFEDFLRDRGVPYERIAPKAEMPNIVAQFEGNGGDPDDGRHLVFNGHFDTFPSREVDRWDRDPFSGAVADGKIHGRGASDMYGGLTASIAAFLYLFEHRDVLQGRVTLTVVSDEESGARWGTKHIVENYPEYRGDAVISGEPSSNGIIRFGERGRAWIAVSVRGDSAHTCSVPRGLSAIDVLLDVLRDVRDLEGDSDLVSVPADMREVILDARPQMDAAYGDGATDRILKLRVNVGTVEGGEKINLVAENAQAEIDIRLPIGTSTDDAVAAVESIADDHPGEIAVTGAPSVTNPYKDPTASDHRHPIFQQLQTAAGRVRDEPPAFSCALAGTDCAYYREAGIPCAVYGPSPHNLGSQNEFIYVDEFMEIVKAQAMAAAGYMAGVDSLPQP
ncbi:MAG: M20/M25/M40 family metallo-hydrolase [Halobacteriales archaeon]